MQFRLYSCMFSYPAFGMTKKNRTNKTDDDQKSTTIPSSQPSNSNGSSPSVAETQKSNASLEVQTSGVPAAEPMIRCEETGETSFCNDPMGSGDINNETAKVSESSTTPFFSASLSRRDKSTLNETGETTFSEDDGEGEANQLETDSSDDEDLAMRLRRRSGSDSEDEDGYEDEDDDEDEDRAEADGEDECEGEEEDYYADDGASQTSNEEEVMDSAKEVDDAVAIPEKEARDQNKKPSGSPVNRRDPTYVPREGAFYLHDARDESGNGDGEVEVAPAPGTVSTRRSGMLGSRWEHDLYIEREQRPRTTEEIVRRYGYDIRKYGPDPTQEVTSGRVVGSSRKRGQARRRGVRFANSLNDGAAFTSKDFPTIEEGRVHQTRKQSSGSRFRSTKCGETLHQSSKVADQVATPNSDAESQEGVRKTNQPILRRGRKARVSTPQEGHKGVVIVGNVQNRRGNRGRGVGRRFFGTEGDGRGGFHNFNSARNRGRVPSTIMPVPKTQPSSQQPQFQLPLQAPRSGKRYSVNRKSHRPELSHEGQEVETRTPTLPDAETQKLYRSFDPSIVAAMVQRHQKENPEAFEAAKGVLLH
ncbi:unnamed protein product [Hydatigera taeniaeformis]|uniref:Protein CASC3 n=1 Tax=Hydatigena taeniaeformis TaxID=6205 RepID=A0A0R3X0B9_HYDTA|nr:unnamed protein product [Hydatigera taeniaeformis]